MDDKGCIGPPDLVVEIISPGNSKKEMKNKFELYEESSVKEYWIVDPLNETIFIYQLVDGKYIGLKPVTDGFVDSLLFPDLKLHTDTIFVED